MLKVSGSITQVILNVKEHATQVDEPSPTTVVTTTRATMPLPVQLESAVAPLESSASGGSMDASVREVVRLPHPLREEGSNTLSVHSLSVTFMMTNVALVPLFSKLNLLFLVMAT